jgi:rhomboid protease GluP
MFGLILFGTFVETNLSKLKYSIIYFFSGFLGNFFSLILLPTNLISLGASGAIFGLIGASFIIVALQKDESLLFLGAIYIILFLLSSFSPNVNAYAHVFGLIGGILCGFLFYRKKHEHSSI